MGNYFDNQGKWSWQNDGEKVIVFTDHGDHTHSVDVTTIPIGEMVSNTGQVMGNQHRAATHDFKPKESEKTVDSKRENFLKTIRYEEGVAKTNEVSRKFTEKVQKTSSSKKISDEGRERGAEQGPGKLGREPNIKVGQIRSSMVTANNMNGKNGQGKIGTQGAKNSVSSMGKGGSGKGTASSGGKSGGGKGAASSGGKAGGGKGTSSGGKGGHGH